MNPTSENTPASDPSDSPDSSDAPGVPTGAVRVAASTELAADTALRVDFVDPVDADLDHRVALVRVGEGLYAIGDRCTHADVSLSEGEIEVDDLTIECPKHGSCFELCTGEPTSLPAVRPVPVYGVTEVGGEIYVTLPAPEESSEGNR
jgi:3-phenylpropionate/trans-cinnamate dioxygenase ferredoxin subunit